MDVQGGAGARKGWSAACDTADIFEENEETKVIGFGGLEGVYCLVGAEAKSGESMDG